jgi:NADH:ubiquinone oxidoreductase subunit K
MNHDTTPELIISAAASKSTWAGVFSMFVGWLVSSNAAIVVGMLVNWYGLRMKKLSPLTLRAWALL